MWILFWLAAAGSTPDASAAARANAVGDKIVCKSERFVGSNMSSRICKTRREWQITRNQTREFLDTERISRGMCVGDNGSACEHSLRRAGQTPTPNGSFVPK